MDDEARCERDGEREPRVVETTGTVKVEMFATLRGAIQSTDDESGKE